MRNSTPYLSIGLCSTTLAGPRAPAFAAPPPVAFQGMRDASAAVALDARTFAMADDEDTSCGSTTSRMEGRSSGYPALPLRKADKPGKKPKKSPETDLEAATALGGLGYWLTSHGRNSNAGGLEDEQPASPRTSKTRAVESRR